jgi:hypothetical protein
MNRVIRKTLRLVLSGMCFIMAQLLFAQDDIAYVRTYGGPYFEEGRQIIECTSGGYAVIGTTGSDVANNTNFYLLRLDENLECLWSKSLGGLEVEKGYSIVEDENQNLFLCGYTNSEGAGGYDVLLIKTNSIGDEQWRRTYGGEDWDFGYKIIQHPEEGFLICGKIYSMGNGGSDGYLLHVDDDGEILSEWTYGGEGDDEFVDVEIRNGKKLIVGTFNGAITNWKSKLWLVELDNQSLITWQYLHEGEDSSYGRGLDFDALNLYACGYISKPNQDEMVLTRFDVENNLLWIKEEGLLGNYYLNDLLVMDYGTLLLGEGDGVGAGENEIMCQSREQGGWWIAGPSVGGENNDYAFRYFQSATQVIYAIGKSSSFNENGDSDLLIVQLPPPLNSPFNQVEIPNQTCLTIDIIPTEIPANWTFINTGNYVGIKNETHNNLKVSIFNCLGEEIIQIQSNEETIELSSYLKSQSLHIITITDNKITTSKIIN